VTAVTGACLAVEAAKFFEVGGFNEAWLPVEYNDIDLCLRLSERGYVSVFEPRARLVHFESASRGANRWMDSRYASEHGYFRERWAARLRDDPYFHPALSLDALEIALG
jgi:GT2 family glycosyltransferase